MRSSRLGRAAVSARRRFAFFALNSIGELKVSRGKLCVTLLLTTFVPPCQSRAPGQDRVPADPAAREIFKRLIEINTTDSVGNVTTAAEAMAAHLRDAGFPDSDLHIAGPTDRKKNLVVRLHGSGARKPILFLGHLDVVEARREDWTTDPFQFVEQDGYFYGRGTQDMKEGDAILVADFIRLKKENYTPDRDLILALTADEEAGMYNGVDWLIKQHRDWIDAEFCINLDGGEFEKRGDQRLRAAIQTSEKVYVDFQLESLNPGGHSSVPSTDNAIYHVADALTRIQSFAFPAEVSEVTRTYFERTAELNSGRTAADLRAIARQHPDAKAIARLAAVPYYNALLRTTCVATMLSGGHAPNALPQTARANVNCRLLPGDAPDQIRATLQRIIADPQVTLTMVPVRAADGSLVPAVAVPASPFLPELIRAMDRSVAAMWGNLPVVATMSTGATDGKITRIAGIPTYGIACLFFEIGDNRAHGKDERIGVQDFYDGVEFAYKLIKTLSTQN
jgi:acetylornithine deacetylase/succinyl-diaminopimelate desuccinylase-like protein